MGRPGTRLCPRRSGDGSGKDQWGATRFAHTTPCALSGRRAGSRGGRAPVGRVGSRSSGRPTDTRGAPLSRAYWPRRWRRLWAWRRMSLGAKRGA
eukprot:2319537-Pleurochrysis_carterae.AAC.2